MNTVFAAAVAAGLSVAGAAGGARADEPIHFKFSVGTGVSSPTFVRATKPFLDKIAAESGGVFVIDVYPGGALASATNVYDRLVSGVYEMCYGIHGPIAGKFPKTSVAELPFLATEAEHSSVALWKLIANGTIADEYADVKPLAVFIYPQSQIHLTKPVRTMEDLKGIKVGTWSHTGGEILEALGAVPISISPGEAYQTAQRRTIAGVVVEWNGVMQFKIDEVTTAHVEANLGSNTGFVLMNKGAFEKLPEAARAMIDRNAGATLAASYGRELESIARDQREAVGKKPGHEIIELAPAERKRWEAKVQPIYEAWIARTPNGAKVLETFKTELAREMRM